MSKMSKSVPVLAAAALVAVTVAAVSYLGVTRAGRGSTAREELRRKRIRYYDAQPRVAPVRRPHDDAYYAKLAKERAQRRTADRLDRNLAVHHAPRAVVAPPALDLSLWVSPVLGTPRAAVARWCASDGRPDGHPQEAQRSQADFEQVEADAALLRRLLPTARLPFITIEALGLDAPESVRGLYRAPCNHLSRDARACEGLMHRVLVRDGLPPAERAWTLRHEVGHCMLHACAHLVGDQRPLVHYLEEGMAELLALVATLCHNPQDPLALAFLSRFRQRSRRERHLTSQDLQGRTVLGREEGVQVAYAEAPDALLAMFLDHGESQSLGDFVRHVFSTRALV